MAATATKRRRTENEIRPKKVIRKVKKQKVYHSSSEDDEEEPATYGAGKASDAPTSRPKYTMKASVLPTKTATNATANPRSILKVSKPAPEPAGSIADGSGSDTQANVNKVVINTAINALQADDGTSDDNMDDEPDLDEVSSQDDDEDIQSESEASITSSQAARAKKKRNDPTAFATSISKILDTKLSTSKRQDPVLSRSKSAAEANQTLADSKLEQKARAQIRAEKKQASEKGRVRDVLGLDTPEVDTGSLLEEEKRLKKTAQRGVVKLFNAVRAAQVKAEEATRQARSEGVVGMQKREERVNEMSKQGFLELISSGGRQTTNSAAVSS